MSMPTLSITFMGNHTFISVPSGDDQIAFESGAIKDGNKMKLVFRKHQLTIFYPPSVIACRVDFADGTVGNPSADKGSLEVEYFGEFSRFRDKLSFEVVPNGTMVEFNVKYAIFSATFRYTQSNVQSIFDLPLEPNPIAKRSNLTTIVLFILPWILLYFLRDRD